MKTLPSLLLSFLTAATALACSDGRPPAAQLDTLGGSSAARPAAPSTPFASQAPAEDAGPEPATTTRDDAGTVAEPPRSRCNPSLLVGGETAVPGTSGMTARLAGITRDELTIAWTSGGTLYVADRANVGEPFESTQAVATDASADSVALGPDGTYLVAIAADRKSFLPFERDARGDLFFPAPTQPFAALVDDLGPSELLGDPVFVNSEVVLLYSVFGESPDTVRLAGRISVFASFFPTDTLAFDEFRAQGTKRRRPTGTGDDFQTIFYWDEVTETEKVAQLEGTESIVSVHDIGARPWAQVNEACDKVYFGAAALSSASAR